MKLDIIVEQFITFLLYTKVCYASRAQGKGFSWVDVRLNDVPFSYPLVFFKFFFTVYLCIYNRVPVCKKVGILVCKVNE